MEKAIHDKMVDTLETAKVIVTGALGISVAQLTQYINLESYGVMISAVKDFGSIVLLFWSIYYVANKGLRMNQTRRFEKEDREKD
jgi:hypothetical protein